MPRTAKVSRTTKETDIAVSLSLDGKGKAAIDTGIGFFDHMLTLAASHGLLDLTVKAKGDLHVDQHHTLEDVGLALGKALKEALGDKAGCRRYGAALIPMDEALAQVAIDLSGRGGFSLKGSWPRRKLKDLDTESLLEFLKAFAAEGALTLHVVLVAGTNGHHLIEAVFKGLGRALCDAVAPDPRRKGIPSTKGVL
jgi:imidazoleglycerol-phosphate dehydratase